MSDNGPYRVLAEGDEVGRFDTHADAQSMADGWNWAYPRSEGYGPDFVVDRPCADADCGYCDLYEPEPTHG